MKAMIVKNEKLVLSDVQKPTPKNGEILIKVYAIGLNRADLLQRKGSYPSPDGWPEWPGLEVSGVIEEIGSNTENSNEFNVGDKVCAIRYAHC